LGRRCKYRRKGRRECRGKRLGEGGVEKINRVDIRTDGIRIRGTMIQC